jgi:hypothetical protein
MTAENAESSFSVRNPSNALLLTGSGVNSDFHSIVVSVSWRPNTPVRPSSLIVES